MIGASPAFCLMGTASGTSIGRPPPEPSAFTETPAAPSLPKSSRPSPRLVSPDGTRRRILPLTKGIPRRISSGDVSRPEFLLQGRHPAENVSPLDVRVGGSAAPHFPIPPGGSL